MEITNESQKEIGFVLTCLMWDAITIDDMKQWIYTIIEREDEYPLFLLDLLDYTGNERITYFRDTIGFEPYWEVSENKMNSLYGIAYMRNIEPIECPFDKEDSLILLNRNPDILKKFKETFPFIEI